MNLLYRKCLLKAALAWAGSLVLLLVAYMLVLGPQRSSKGLIENQLVQKRRAYESALMTTQDKAVLELNTQIERLQNRLNDFVIEFKDAANLTFDVSRIAGEKKLGLFSLKVEGAGIGTTEFESDYLHENMINVSFTGDFYQFATFLNAMERHRPVVFVDECTVARSDESHSGHQVSMTLTVFVKHEQES
jgi:Tfp pilus assembly protein PilO